VSSILNDEARTPADSTLAAYCNDRNSARPAGSSGKKLHQIRDDTEGGALTILLQRMSLLLAQGV
jgi:hypothetical protein